MAELLGSEGRGVPGVAPTLRDGDLARQAQELRSVAALACRDGQLLW